MPEDSGLYFGRPGSIASRGANFVQQNADFILTIGARLDLPQVGHSYDNFARDAKKSSLILTKTKLRKLRLELKCQLVSDAKEFLEEFINKIDRVRTKRPFGAGYQNAKMEGKKYPVIIPEYLKPTELCKYICLDRCVYPNFLQKMM